MYQDLTGVILSGGKSSRMGENKSFLKIGNSTVIETLSNMMKSIFKEVIIITNEPDIYSFLKLTAFQDLYKNAGPLAGIHSGLIHSRTERNFIISCDIPLINADYIESLIEYPSHSEIVVARDDGFVQQLCGIYNRSLIPKIEKLLNESENPENRNSIQIKRKCKVHSLIDSANAEIIENPDKLKGYRNNIYLNLNRPEDYTALLEIIQLNN